jgi:hypothetical protein
LVTKRSALGIGFAALLLLAPSLMLGTHVTNSSPQNLTWAAQFSEQFRAGILYPRWMPSSFDGLGGPNFYFYPPLAFWIDALLSVATANLLSLSYRLALSSALILFASGLAMYAWLKLETLKPRVALWGAITYMAAPYHLLDHYMRGAMAEFTAYVALPVVVLGIRLIADRRPSGPPTLALGYAALVVAHLPTALLASCTVIPAYVLFKAHRWSALWRCAAAGALGLGVVAIYLAPALTLQDWISADAWWIPRYDPTNWLLLAPQRWPPEAQLMASIVALSIGVTLIAAGLAALRTRMPAGDSRRSELAFWIAVSLGGIALIAGVVPWVWRIDLMARVQFPWRLMSIVEFAIITGVCVSPLDRMNRFVRYTFAVAATAIVVSGALIGANATARFQITLSGAPLEQRDVKPNQPRGFPQDPRTRYDELGLEPLAKIGAISCTPAAPVCTAQVDRFGAMRLHIESSQPTTVVLRRFYFPAWQVEALPSHQAVALQPTDPLRLVSFVAPAGNADFQLVRVMLPAERWGCLVSGLSLVLLLGWVVTARRAQSILR